MTVFSAVKVTDNATYAKGALPSTGIPYVIVDGTVVVRDSNVEANTNSGQPIRYPRTRSRFEPLRLDAWSHQFYAAPVDFGGGVPGSQPNMHME